MLGKKATYMKLQVAVVQFLFSPKLLFNIWLGSFCPFPTSVESSSSICILMLCDIYTEMLGSSCKKTSKDFYSNLENKIWTIQSY